MNIPIASRISRLGTETAFEVLARAKALEKQGKSVIHFEIGEPDFDTPKHIIDAGIKVPVFFFFVSILNFVCNQDVHQTLILFFYS